MKRIEHLIKMARRNTENEQTGVTDGISQEDFVRYCNEANKLVRSKLVQSHSQKFVTVTTKDAVVNQEFYDVPNNSYLNYNLVNVFYSDTGNAMYRLDKRDLINRVPIKGRPSKWIPSGNGFYANPIPQSSSGVFYINLVERTRELALRSSTVSSSTYDSGTRALTALTLAAYSANGTLADQNFDEEDYLTIVDASGNVKMQGIQYSSIDTSTGVVTLEGASYTAPEGSSIANGDYVVKGKFASSHSQLDYEAQDAVLAWMEYLVFNRDSSNDSQGALQNFDMYLNDLIDSFEKDKQEMYQIPIVTDEYM